MRVTNRSSRQFTMICRRRRIRFRDGELASRGILELKMSRVSTIKMTARQFLELGEDPPGVRLELVDGEIAVSPSPIPDHSYTVGTLYTILRAFIDRHRLGIVLMDVDTVFGEHEVRRPDIFYFTTA